MSKTTTKPATVIQHPSSKPAAKPAVAKPKRFAASFAAETLKEACGLLKGTRPRNTNLPVIECVLMRWRDGGIELATTTLDGTGVYRVPAPAPPLGEKAMAIHQRVVAARNGSGIAVPWKDFESVAKAADSGTPVRFDEGDYDTEIQFVRKGRAVSMASEHFPSKDFPEPHQIFPGEQERTQTSDNLPATATRALRRLKGKPPGLDLPSAGLENIALLKHASSRDETRYVLNGIFLSPEGWAVATDGRRLASAPHYIDKPEALGDGVILPNGLPPVIGQALAQRGDAILDIHPEYTMVRVCQGRYTLFVKPIQGNFPNFRQVIPVPKPGDTVVAWPNRETLSQAAALCRDIARSTGGNSQYTPSVQVTVDYAADRVTLGSKRVKPVEFPATIIADELLAENPAPPPLVATFSAAYMADLMDFGVTKWTLRDETFPLLATSRDGRLYVLMPMRTS
jgi:DNA polymerase III sliding clamp (beta) subunit (PCNA family)